MSESFEQVSVELWRNGVLFRAFTAYRLDDLNCPVEMMTGVGWLDIGWIYHTMLETGCDQLVQTDRVCHSYEKWGDLQQEVEEIEVRMQRVNTQQENLRAEWYREWYLAETAFAGWIPGLPRWYRLGMALSAIWVVVYLLIYPSLPLPWAQTHWQGLGVPGGCQPWTAICEMQQGEAVLQDVRGKYLSRVQKTPVAELVEDGEIREFARYAGKVPFGDQCAGCHGQNGSGIAAAPEAATVLNDAIWVHGRSVGDIQASIQSDRVHPFGLSRRIDESTARLLALYVHQFVD